MDYKEKVIALLNSQELSKEQKEKLENIFPELKESEDEKIKKGIIDFIKHESDIYGIKTWCNGYTTEEIIDWLEKQGKKTNPYSGISFEYNGHIWGMCARDNGVDILLDKQLFKHLEKQSEPQAEQEIDDKDAECLLNLVDDTIFAGRRFSDFEISSEYVKAGDIVLESDGLNFKYRILTRVDGKHWEYFENGYYFSTSPEYCHWLVKGQKNYSNGELVKIIY